MNRDIRILWFDLCFIFDSLFLPPYLLPRDVTNSRNCIYISIQYIFRFSLLFSSFFLPFSYSNVIGMLEEETEGTLRKKRLREIRRCWSVFPRELLEQFLRSISHANLPWIYRAITGQTYFCLWSTLIENGGALKYVVSSFLLSFLIFSPSSVASSYSTFYLFVKRISKLRISTL